MVKRAPRLVCVERAELQHLATRLRELREPSPYTLSIYADRLEALARMKDDA
jgi:hypothetical protein